MVNAGTQIRAATAPFMSLGCCRNATARGRSAPFVPEVIPGNTSRSLCSAAGPQGTSRSPMVTQFTAGCTGLQPSSLRGESGPNSAMKNNPGFINTVEKKKLGLTLAGFASLSTGHGVDAHPCPLPRHSSGPALQNLHVGCKLTPSSQEALSNVQDPPKLAQNSAQRPQSWKVLSHSDSATHLWILARVQHEQDQPLAVIIRE